MKVKTYLILRPLENTESYDQEQDVGQSDYRVRGDCRPLAVYVRLDAGGNEQDGILGNVRHGEKLTKLERRSQQQQQIVQQLRSHPQ